MDRLMQKNQNAIGRKRRVRAAVSGHGKRPRLSIAISNRHIIAQIIDDDKHATLAYITTVGHKDAPKGTMVERASWVGQQIAKKAQQVKIKQVVLDRGKKLYHGRVQALADAARKEGLEF